MKFSLQNTPIFAEIYKHQTNDLLGTDMTPDAALQKLIDGNKRFIVGFDEPDSFIYQEQKIKYEQNPYACILGCADSRVSPEHAFDESHGNLFVARVAGNFVTPEILASLEYGTSVLGASIIVVLGHTGCGAINATIKAVTSNQVFEGEINTLVDALKPAVNQTSTDNLAHWKDSAVIANVLKNVALLTKSEPVLSKLIKEGKLKVVGGIYNLETGKVEFLTS